MSVRAIDRAVARAARGWLGTPYRHQGSRRGVGADCLGLLRGVWREVVGPEPFPVPPYGRDWAEADPADRLLAAAEALFEPAGEIDTGTVLVFRWSPGAAAKHCGVAIGPERMIHAYSGRGVVENAIAPSWRRRVAARRRFREPLPARPSFPFEPLEA